MMCFEWDECPINEVSTYNNNEKIIHGKMRTKSFVCKTNRKKKSCLICHCNIHSLQAYVHAVIFLKKYNGGWTYPHGFAKIGSSGCISILLKQHMALLVMFDVNSYFFFLNLWWICLFSLEAKWWPPWY